MDIREEDTVLAAVAKAFQTFGGIDILVNNASAISLTDTEATPMKRFDLMNGVNARGTYLLFSEEARSGKLAYCGYPTDRRLRCRCRSLR